MSCFTLFVSVIYCFFVLVVLFWFISLVPTVCCVFMYCYRFAVQFFYEVFYKLHVCTIVPNCIKTASHPLKQYLAEIRGNIIWYILLFNCHNV
jgi:hypothetical protein